MAKMTRKTDFKDLTLLGRKIRPVKKLETFPNHHLAPELHGDALYRGVHLRLPRHRATRLCQADDSVHPGSENP